jgi:hypothetical protein
MSLLNIVPGLRGKTHSISPSFQSPRSNSDGHRIVSCLCSTLVAAYVSPTMLFSVLHDHPWIPLTVAAPPRERISLLHLSRHDLPTPESRLTDLSDKRREARSTPPPSRRVQRLQKANKRMCFVQKRNRNQAIIGTRASRFNTPVVVE